MSLITVYSTKTCAYCDLVKKFLSMKGKEYSVVDLEESPDVRQDLYKKTGAMTVPITQVGEEFIVGWNPGKLAALV